MPALKLFSPDERDQRPSAPTLDEVFTAEVQPRLESRRRAVATVHEYRRAVKVWEEFWREHGGSPGLTTIDEDALDQFQEHLAETRAGRTVNKIMGYLQAVLDQCGPRRSGNTGLGRRLGLVDSVPRFVRVDEPTAKRGRVATLEQVRVMLDHCHIATHPRHQAALKWSAAIRLLFWAGPRRNDLFLHLRRSNWIQSTRCPLAEVSIDWPWGWLSFTPAKTARKKPAPLVIPLPRELHFDLLAIRHPAGEVDPPLLGFAHCTRDWAAGFARIQIAAGIADPYTFQDGRKSANVHWQQTISAGTGNCSSVMPPAESISGTTARASSSWSRPLNNGRESNCRKHSRSNATSCSKRPD